MRSLQWLSGGLIGISALLYASESQLSYGGWTVDSTIQAERERYPHSPLSDNSIDVADADSHDDIRYVSAGVGWVSLRFDTRQASGKDTYPLCQNIFDRIYVSYGGPDIVQHFYEEAVKVHLRVWKRGTEHLALECFLQGGEYYAEKVELYRFGDGAT